MYGSSIFRIAGLCLAAVAASGACGCGSSSPKSAADPEAPRPSGEVRDHVRVIPVKARRYAFDPTPIVVRQGKAVRLEITSEDTTHGFQIAAYRIDQVLPPHEMKVVTFTADRPGRFDIVCSAFCGIGHGFMRGELIVLQAGGGTP